jgi:hypothetical protein
MQQLVPASQNLTERQAAFIPLFVQTGDAYGSAIAVGYAPITAKHAAADILNKPSVALQIARAARLRLAKSLPMALSVLDHLAEHANSERVKLEAAKAICDRAGLVAPRAPDPPAEFEKPLHELTQDQLYALVAKWQASVAVAEHELADRAKPINAAPASDPVADLIG